MNSPEEWRDAVGYEGLYRVSSTGRVMKLNEFGASEMLMSQQKSNTGYFRVPLSGPEKRRTVSVARLVALAFVPNPEGKPQVNHIDGNKLNNSIGNLEWNTSRENGEHAARLGLKASGLRHGAYTKPETRRVGSRNGRAKLTESDVVLIRTMIAAGLGSAEIAKQFNVSHASIWWIKKGAMWKHVA